MSETTLFEETTESLNDTTLLELKRLCEEQESLEKDIVLTEESLKAKKKQLEKISREAIPTFLSLYNLSEIKLANGKKVMVEDKIKASIANKNYLLAYKNMINTEGGDENAKKIVDTLFKSSIIIEDMDAANLLIENEVPYESKRTIHSQTLKKYCRTKLDKGQVIPEGISVFQYQETKIK